MLRGHGSINHPKRQDFNLVSIRHEQQSIPAATPVPKTTKRPENLPLLWGNRNLLLELPLRLHDLPGVYG